MRRAAQAAEYVRCTSARLGRLLLAGQPPRRSTLPALSRGGRAEGDWLVSIRLFAATETRCQTRRP